MNPAHAWVVALIAATPDSMKKGNPRMAHDHVKHLVEEESKRANALIIATFVGGVLLINAALAQFLFDKPQYSDLLAMIAAMLLGAPLIWQAAKDLWAGQTHMNELAALGVLAAFALGASGAEGHGGYLTAGGIAFFMIIAVLIETRTALGARKSIESLIRITPTRASKVTDEGETEVEAASLTTGDIVRVRPGDNIPGDGEIITGTSTVNQANITGESLPVDKVVGDEVFGGTINVNGVIDVRITKAGKDTTLGRVQELILQAEQTKTPISRIIDHYAHWYTPTILMLVGVVFFFTKDPKVAIAMLVIACPSAIILATPTAMVAALSAAARLGVLVKNVTDLETARKLTAIVFDKTGTLTTGRLSVTRLNPIAGVEGADLLRATFAAEQNSKHPVARAVVKVAQKARITAPQPTSFEEVAGKGVKVVVEGHTILVGRESFLVENGIDVSEIDTADAEGISLLFVARDGLPLGWVGLEDKTRADAAGSMDDLRELGVRQLVMVTGDRWSVARRVAAEMHCTDVQAEVLPGQKLEMVDALKEKGHTVAVVGDGVNDAPALAAGDISIAMGAAGSDVAIHSASIALMNNNLNRIPFLIQLSRQSMTVVRQNLIAGILFIIVFGVATVLFPMYITPIVAVLLHLAIDLLVIFNSARLVRAGEDLNTLIEEDEGPRRSIKVEKVTQSPPTLPNSPGSPALS